MTEAEVPLFTVVLFTVQPCGGDSSTCPILPGGKKGGQACSCMEAHILPLPAKEHGRQCYNARACLVAVVDHARQATGAKKAVEQVQAKQKLPRVEELQPEALMRGLVVSHRRCPSLSHPPNIPSHTIIICGVGENREPQHIEESHLRSDAQVGRRLHYQPRQSLVVEGQREHEALLVHEAAACAATVLSKAAWLQEIVAVEQDDGLDLEVDAQGQSSGGEADGDGACTDEVLHQVAVGEREATVVARHAARKPCDHPVEPLRTDFSVQLCQPPLQVRNVVSVLGSCASEAEVRVHRPHFLSDPGVDGVMLLEPGWPRLLCGVILVFVFPEGSWHLGHLAGVGADLEMVDHALVHFLDELCVVGEEESWQVAGLLQSLCCVPRHF
mmetsp:Transcript_21878/g.85749  ORF Transcript_21878/g.85749 Transcript_21878/m.85749 type:complete len:385 (-) Transcript_21878:52-1206(-)